MKKLLFLFGILSIIHFDLIGQPCLPEGILLTTQEQVDSFQTNYPGCTEIEGDLSIGAWWESTITDLNGLKVIEAVYSNLLLHDNDILEDLTGLDNLSHVGGDIYIDSNGGLISLSGLEGLDHINDKLIIQNNYKLLSLEGLNNVDSVMGKFQLVYNTNLVDLSALSNLKYTGQLFIKDDDNLENFAGLGNLESVENGFIIFRMDIVEDFLEFESLKSVGYIHIDQCDNLKSLHGLENIEINLDPNYSDHLVLTNNPKLSECGVKSICDIINGTEYGKQIYNNANECNSVQEVKEVCESAGLEDVVRNSISIYPNPTENIVVIDSKIIPVDEVRVFNQLGQLLIFEKQQVNYVDVSALNKGIFIIELVVGGNILKEKLVIK